MPTTTWDLALAELLFYTLTIPPVLYCLIEHRRVGISGWLYLAIFNLLQIIGSGWTLSAGQNGTPSTSAVIITNVGISPLMLATAGIVSEWARIAGVFKTTKRMRLGRTCEIVYHIAVMTAIAIYATGASNANSGEGEKHAVNEWKVGVVLLLLLWVVLFATFALLARKIGINFSKALFWSITISFAFTGIRIIYQCVATFKRDQGSFNPVTGSIALRVVFQFLPGAFVLTALVVGGVTSMKEVAASYTAVRSDIPLTPQGIEAGDSAREPIARAK